jgi:hypothetical protein
MIKSIEETCQVSMEKIGYDKYSINATNEEILFKSPAEIWLYQLILRIKYVYLPCL